MGIAGGKKPVCFGRARIVLNGLKECRRRFVKPVFEEIHLAHMRQGRTELLARAEAKCSFDVLHREIGFTGSYSKDAALIPAPRKAWVEPQCAINQTDHGTDILAEACQHKRRIDEDTRIAPR